MADSYLPLLLMVALSIGFGALLLGLSRMLGPRRDHPVKLEPFESGNPVHGIVRGRFNVKFYLVAILFLVFDLEVVFVYPWAVVFSDAVKGKSDALDPWSLGLAMLLFVAILVVSLIYEWRKGALEWNERDAPEGVRITPRPVRALEDHNRP